MDFTLLKDAGKIKIEFSELVVFVLKNFDAINSIDQFLLQYDQFLLDITDNPEQKFIQEMTKLSTDNLPEYEHHVFAFSESNIINGLVELDFVGELVNCRIQLFAESIISTLILNKKHKNLLSFLSQVFKSSPVDDQILHGLVWKDDQRKIIVALRKEKKPRNYISFSITSDKTFEDDRKNDINKPVGKSSKSKNVYIGPQQMGVLFNAAISKESPENTKKAAVKLLAALHGNIKTLKKDHEDIEERRLGAIRNSSHNFEQQKRDDWKKKAIEALKRGIDQNDKNQSVKTAAELKEKEIRKTKVLEALKRGIAQNDKNQN
jgi:hypothetical protein